VSSLLSLALGFEKDLKMSDFSRFRGSGLLDGFLSIVLVSAWEVDVLGLPLDEGRSEGFEPSVLLRGSRGLVLGFSLLLATGAAGACMAGRFPVLRCGTTQSEWFCFRERATNLDAIIVDDAVLVSYDQWILADMLCKYCPITFRQDLEVLATSS